MNAAALWNKLNQRQRDTLCGLPADGVAVRTPSLRKLIRLQLVELASTGWRATDLGRHVAKPPIVFLDMDGVCARVIERPRYSWETEEAWKARQATAFERIDAPSMLRLNAIAERTGAVFVMSSTWRLTEKSTPESYQRVMRERGFAGKLVGFTPVIPNRPRWMEIERYMEHLSPKPRSFVVLEDYEPMGPLTPRTVVTDDVRLITDANVERAVALLTT